MARAVFEQVNIVSGDPTASIAFYRRLGVELPGRVSGGRRRAFTMSAR